MVNDVTLKNYEEGRDIYLSLTWELREKISNAKTDKELNFYKDKFSTLIQNVLYLRWKTVEKWKKGACWRYSEPKLKKRISCSNNQFLWTPKIIDKKIFSLIQELEENLEKYRWNENQVKLAKKIWISHLWKLHSMLSVLWYIKDLKYNKIDLPVKQVELLIQKLEKGIKPYRWNENQIKLADDMWISNLWYLYSALSALWYVKKLEYKGKYNNINLPVAKVKLLIQKLEEKLEDYVWNENQIKLADDLWISHLWQLYNVLSALWYIEKLEYNYINLPVEQVKKLGWTFLQICNLRIKYRFYLTDIVKKSLSDIPLYTEFILFLVKSEWNKSNFSKDRLIRYMLKNVTKENMQYFKDILLDSTRYLWEINSLIDYEKKNKN